MKKYNALYNILLVMSTVTFLSCDDNELVTYNSDANIYFNYPLESSTKGIDSVYVLTGIDSPVKTDSIIQVKVKLMGKFADYDRNINFTLVDTSSTAVLGRDIELLPSVIPANSDIGYVRVKLKNSEESKKELLATLRLLPNDQFRTDYNNANIAYSNFLEFRVFYTSRADMPNLWAALPKYFGMFGDYSHVKFDLICEVCKIDREFFTYDPSVETATEAFSSRNIGVLSWTWIRAINRYLDEYNTKNGGPLLDENKEEVKMGSGYI